MTEDKSNAELDAITIAQDENAKLKHLAGLNDLKYGRERKTAALELGISVTVLDQLIKKARRAETSDTRGQGRPLELREIEPWPEPVNGAGLLDDICNAIRRYLVLPHGSAEILTLWVAHTHAFDCFGHTPRLAITSPEKGCGKTTTLEIVGELVARPLSTSNATTAAIFRTVEKASPTILIDEADTFLKDNEELRGLLNAGHRRGGQIIRTVGDDHEPRQFATFAPAAIAMIGRLPDTLADRSVNVRLRRKRPTERVQAFRSDRVADLHELARKVARWAADHRETLASAEPNVGTLFNRAADNWRPLLSVADIARGDWPTKARYVAEASEAAKQDQSTKILLLSDIRDIIAKRPDADRISSVELAAMLGAMEGRPWAEWGRHGKPMTATALARQLEGFDIAPGTKRAGTDTFKGYLHSDFDDAFASYLSDPTVTPSQLNNDGQCDAFQTVTPEDDVTLSKASQPNNHGHCDGVTDEPPAQEKQPVWSRRL